MADKLLSTIKREHNADPLGFDACRIYKRAETGEHIVKPMRAGVVQPERSWYFGTDKADAQGTACAMLWGALNASECEALAAYRRIHRATDWRECLGMDWMRSRYAGMSADHGAVLQCLRNTRGPEWLRAMPV